jgi:hypothetical protein
LLPTHRQLQHAHQQITPIRKRDTPALISKKSFLEGDGKLKSDGSRCRMITGIAARELSEQRPRLSLREISAAQHQHTAPTHRRVPRVQ